MGGMPCAGDFPKRNHLDTGIDVGPACWAQPGIEQQEEEGEAKESSEEYYGDSFLGCCVEPPDEGGGEDSEDNIDPPACMGGAQNEGMDV